MRGKRIERAIKNTPKDENLKGLQTLVLILIVLVSGALIAGSLLMLLTYSQSIEEEASYVGMRYSGETANHLKVAVDEYEERAENLARNVMRGSVSTSTEFGANLRHLGVDDSDLMFARYFKDGTEYSVSGVVYSAEAKEVLALVEQGVRACAGVISDREHSVSAVAFCVPLSGCPYADTIVLFYPVNTVISFPEPLDPEITDKSRITAVTSHEGEVLSILYQDEEDGLGLRDHNNIYEALRGQINDKSTIDRIQNNISTGTSDVYSVQISTLNHVISVSTLRENDSAAFAIIGVYRSEVLHGTGYSTVRAILGVLIIFSFMLLIMVISNIISRRRAAKRLKTVGETNDKLGVATRIKFERVAADTLNRNRATQFAVVAVDMRHFNYISDQLGEVSITDVLLYLKMLFSRLVALDETFAYAGNGRWLLLLHYRELEQLETRLKSTVALAASYNAKMPSGYHLNLYGGIYLTSHNLVEEIGKMIELAISAEDALNFPCDFSTFRIYNEKIHESKALEDYIEVHMESALESHQFQVFYQPKYNLSTALPDGCEALVRWYNPETDDYMQPGVFIPLFEANRFIVKLDHNVYEQVCEYIEEAVARGQTLYPVSVNVSRITAADADFCSYYAAVKRKHKIADGFLTIEFTESFAYEDYDRLRAIVNELHKNGFKCSIDDFGSGFSSYSILKELPMDEIKLDRFFIDRGIDESRDLKILSSVINVGRDLGMKVTQEGVETPEQLALLKKLGCHVIQGFHYSKPMRLSDYIEFITRKSHSNLFTQR